EAGGRLGLSVDRVSIRDLAAEIEWAKVSLVTAEDYATKAADSGRELVGGHDRATISRLIVVYEDANAERRALDFEDVLLLSTGTSSWTSTRTSRRCSSGCSTCGSASARSCAWSVTSRRPSTPSPVPPRTTSPSSPAATPMRPWCASCATTAPPRRWSRWPTR